MITLAKVVQRRVAIVVLDVDANVRTLEQFVENGVVRATHSPVQRSVAKLVLDVDVVATKVWRSKNLFDNKFKTKFNSFIKRLKKIIY